jgi:hypothetical protein
MYPCVSLYPCSMNPSDGYQMDDVIREIESWLFWRDLVLHSGSSYGNCYFIITGMELFYKQTISFRSLASTVQGCSVVPVGVCT